MQISSIEGSPTPFTKRGGRDGETYIKRGGGAFNKRGRGRAFIKRGWGIFFFSFFWGGDETG